MRKMLFLLVALLILILPWRVTADTLVDKRIMGEQMNCKSLDEVKTAELIKIANLLEKKDTEYFIKRWNEQVLTSKNKLLEEQQLLSLYPWLRRNDEVEKGTKNYLELYTSTLTYFEQLLQEEKELQVESLSLKESSDFRMYQLHATLDDKKEVETIYFPGTLAYSNYYRMKQQSEEKILDSFKVSNIHYLKATIIDPLFNLLFKNPLGNAFDTVEDYEKGKEDLAWEIEVNESLIAVGALDMEFAIVEGDLGKRDKQMRKVYVYPVTFTYDQLERWEEVHKINNEVPYPEEAVKDADWIKTSEALLHSESKMNEIDLAIYLYINNGKLPDNATVEDVAQGLSEQSVP